MLGQGANAPEALLLCTEGGAIPVVLQQEPPKVYVNCPSLLPPSAPSGLPTFRNFMPVATHQGWIAPVD